MRDRSNGGRPGRLVLGVLAAALSLTSSPVRGEGVEAESMDAFDNLYRSGQPAYSNSPAAAAARQSQGTSTFTNRGFRQTGGTAEGQSPWSGHWWPRRPCELGFRSFSQQLSPHEKYDTIVFNNYGQNPGAAAWEADPANTHNDGPHQRTVDWSGHCNGLAAAAILEAEPRRHITIPLNRNPAYGLKLNIGAATAATWGLSADAYPDYNYQAMSSPVLQLTIADMKGWLAESYMAVYTLQFANRDVGGTRNDSTTANHGDPAYTDIHPHYFHYLLQQYVKKGQPVIIEIDPGFPVNNHPLYKFDSQGVWYADQRRYAVTTEVYVTDYAPSYHFVGTKPKRIVYTYDLHCDEHGRVTTGVWTGRSVYNHPDYAWIPTTQAGNYLNYNNPKMDFQFMRGLIRQSTGN